MEANISLIENDLQDELYTYYPFLQQLDQQSLLRLLNNSLSISLPPQTFMQTEKGPYEHLFLLLEGTIRTYQSDENGRELTFYRTFPGDIDPLNLHQIFHNKPGQALAKSESVIRGIQVSARVVKQLIQESAVFRDVMFQKLTGELNHLTTQMQRAVFDKLDIRLCKLLKDLFLRSDQLNIKITHQKLANELGTTREVISRSLKALENKGCLKISRGQLIMVNPSKLGIID